MSEKEFIDSRDSSLRAFAVKITSSGLSLYKIAKLSGLSWRTVHNATNGIPIRFDNAERIKLVLRTYGQNH